MNINKWLCERYDKENKGYVVISDITLDIFIMTGIIIYIGLFLNGARLFISLWFLNSFNHAVHRSINCVFGNVNPVLATPFEAISLMCFICFCVIIVACITYIIIYCICTTKIAKCER